MNHGHLTSLSDPEVGRRTAVASVTGTIQSARASFVVVATVSATEPYARPAPTTELVS